MDYLTDLEKQIAQSMGYAPESGESTPEPSIQEPGKKFTFTPGVLKWENTINQHLQQQPNVDSDLVKAVMQQESGGQNVTSHAGAHGPMQLMPATAKRLGVDINNPEENVKGGISELSQLLKEFGGDKRKALAAYNWGGARKAFKEHPNDWENYLPEETSGYLQKIGAMVSLGKPQNIEEIIARSMGLELPKEEGAAAPVTPETDSGFQQYLQKYGVKDFGDPRSHYDYYAAYKAGAIPQKWSEAPAADRQEDVAQGRFAPGGDMQGASPDQYMWPDEYKLQGHPIPPRAPDQINITQPKAPKIPERIPLDFTNYGKDPSEIKPPMPDVTTEEGLRQSVKEAGPIDAFFAEMGHAMSFASDTDADKIRQELFPASATVGTGVGMVAPALIPGGVFTKLAKLRKIAQVIGKYGKAGKAAFDAMSRMSITGGDYAVRNRDALFSNDPAVREKAIKGLVAALAASGASVAPEILKSGWWQPILQGLTAGATNVAAQKVTGEDPLSTEAAASTIFQTVLSGVFGLGMAKSGKPSIKKGEGEASIIPEKWEGAATPEEMGARQRGVTEASVKQQNEQFQQEAQQRFAKEEESAAEIAQRVKGIEEQQRQRMRETFSLSEGREARRATVEEGMYSAPPSEEQVLVNQIKEKYGDARPTKNQVMQDFGVGKREEAAALINKAYGLPQQPEGGLNVQQEEKGRMQIADVPREQTVSEPPKPAALATPEPQPMVSGVEGKNITVENPDPLLGELGFTKSNKSIDFDNVDKDLSTGTISDGSIAVVDLTNLGKLNKAVGHDEADKIIKEVVSILNKHIDPLGSPTTQIRKNRTGGDELTIIARNIAPDKLDNVLYAARDEIDAFVANKEIDFHGRKIRLSQLGHAKEDDLVTGSMTIDPGVAGIKEFESAKGAAIVADKRSYAHAAERKRAAAQKSLENGVEFVYNTEEGQYRQLPAVVGKIIKEKIRNGEWDASAPYGVLEQKALELINKGGTYERIRPVQASTQRGDARIIENRVPPEISEPAAAAQRAPEPVSAATTAAEAPRTEESRIGVYTPKPEQIEPARPVPVATEAKAEGKTNQEQARAIEAPEEGKRLTPGDVKPDEEPNPQLMGGVSPTNLPKYVQHFNIEKSPDMDNRLLLAKQAEQYAPVIQAARDVPVRRWDEVTRLSQQTGVLARGINRRVGKALSDRELRAINDHLEQVTDDYKNALKQFEGQRAQGKVTDNDRIALAELANYHAFVLAQATGANSEAGRALAILRQIRNAKNQAESLADLSEQIKNGGFDDKDITKLVNYINKSKDLSAINKAPYWKKTLNSMYEIWLNWGLLSNPVTHTANITSNALTSLIRTAAEKPVATLVDPFVARIQKRKTERFMGEIFPEVQGQLTAITRIFGAGKTGLDQGGIKTMIRAIGREFEQVQGMFGEKIEYPAQIRGLAGELIRGPGNALQAGDLVFKKIVYEGEVLSRAYRQARIEGLRGGAFKRRSEELVKKVADPATEDKIAAQIRRASMQEAQYRTYTQALGNIGRNIMRTRNAIPGARYIVPFIRTPLNILKYGLERLPGTGYLTLYKKITSGEIKGAEISDQIAKLIVGHIMAIPMVLAARAGIITGSGPEDKNERKALEASGWQPYEFKLRDLAYSFRRLEPLATILGIAADFVEIARATKDEDKLSGLAAQLAGSIAKNITSKTFTEQVAQFYSAIQDPERYGTGFVKRFATSLVPGVVRGVAHSMDPRYRGKETLGEYVQSVIPGKSQELPPKRDVLGKEIEKEGGFLWNFVVPIRVRKNKSNPVLGEINRLRVPLSMPSKKIYGQELTTKQFDEYGKIAGEQTYKLLENLINSPSYKNMNDNLRSEFIKKKVATGRDQARKILSGKYKFSAISNIDKALERQGYTGEELRQQRELYLKKMGISVDEEEDRTNYAE
jgi:GGDEF domain-containing protein